MNPNSKNEKDSFEITKIIKNISKELPKKELVSIYKKVKEEKTKIIFILKRSKILPTLQKIIEKNTELLKFENVEIKGYSLWELEKKKKAKFKNQIKDDPSKFLNELEQYALIEGKKIEEESLKR